MHEPADLVTHRGMSTMSASASSVDTTRKPWMTSSNPLSAATSRAGPMIAPESIA